MARGDALLRGVAQLIVAKTRVNDLTCRLGGDEFAVLLPETPVEGALEPVRRILAGMEEVDAGGVRQHSASIGVAGLADGQSPEKLLAAARAALEQARESGGGRFAIHSSRLAETESQTIAAHGDVVSALASALVERDRYTHAHSESVVDLASNVASSIGLELDAVANVRTAALLHDIGKVGVPDGLLRKTGPLDEGEWAMMRQHPVIGERILRAIPGMGGVARMVRHEHERWDGCGYPDGIAGEEIPLGSRIVLACDAYHAMTSDRPYREAMTHADAVAELVGNAGSQFDPEVVETLVGILYGRGQAGPAAKQASSSPAAPESGRQSAQGDQNAANGSRPGA